MIKIKKENEVMDLAFRKGAINFFKKDVDRVEQSRVRQDIFNDKTRKYVISAMVEESGDKTIRKDIENRASNISFAKKIIKKKAMIYKDGARRIASMPDKQDVVDLATDLLNINMVQKKTNRYSELHKNAIVGCLPFKNEVTSKYYLKARTLAPHEYFPIVDSVDNEKLRGVVIPYQITVNKMVSGEASRGKRNGDNDEVMGRTVEATQYIWWLSNYHFTTDAKGEIIEGLQDANFSNPIGKLPFADFSQIKDGTFIVEGGNDLIESSLLLNVLLTDMYYITKYQGMGLGYLFGKGVPKNLKVGPSSFISLEVEENDPTPQIGFATSNPPIDAHIRQVEQQLAMLLSTNGVDAGTIAGTLTAQNISGVSKIVDKADLTDDIEDQKEIYRDNEPILYDIIFSWVKIFGKEKLDAKFADLYFDGVDKLEVTTTFNQAAAYSTEEERLRIIEKRLELGLDSLEDALRRDNSEISKEDILKKLSNNSIKVTINESDKEDQSEEIGVSGQS